MESLLASERKKYHKALLENGVLTIDSNGIPSNADKSSKLSISISTGIANALMAETAEKAVGQTSGAKFELINNGIFIKYISQIAKFASWNMAYSKIG